MDSKSKRKISGEKIVFLIMILAVVIVYGGVCGRYYINEAVINHKTDKIYKEQMAAASDSALKYIREKYEVEAEILEDPQTYDYNRDILELAIRYHEDEVEDIYIFLKMTDGSREFYVNVKSDGQPDNLIVSDNYQYDEIKAAFADRISEELPGGNVLDMRLCDKKVRSSYYSFFDIYYSGDNIDEIIDRCSGKVEVAFTYTDFSGSEIVKKLDGSGIDYRFVSFVSSERTEEFAELVREHIYNSDKYYSEYSEYMVHYREKKDGKVNNKM
ncbi:MAG: hypothetical protein K2K57_11240 [Oscillospiraceae bacterium]|nr:hypothetical protein [Oscillospiraceae bacterium]